MKTTNVAVLAKVGVEISTAISGDKKITPGWVVHCSKCAAKEFKRKPKNIRPQVLIGEFERAGWSLDQKHGTLCKTCAKKAGRTSDNLKSVSEPEGEMQDKKPLRGAALQRRLFEVLDAAYDEEAQRYRPGYNDEVVSNTIGVSVDHVAKTREEAYGPLVDPKVEELSGRISVVEGDLIKALEELERIDQNLKEARTELFKLAKGS